MLAPPAQSQGFGFGSGGGTGGLGGDLCASEPAFGTGGVPVGPAGEASLLIDPLTLFASPAWPMAAASPSSSASVAAVSGVDPGVVPNVWPTAELTTAPTTELTTEPATELVTELASVLVRQTDGSSGRKYNGFDYGPGGLFGTDSGTTDGGSSGGGIGTFQPSFTVYSPKGDQAATLNQLGAQIAGALPADAFGNLLGVETSGGLATPGDPYTPQPQQDGSILDPTNLRNDGTGNGLYNPGTGSDVDGDDMLGPNGENLMYRPFLRGVNRLARAGQAAGNIAGSFNPLVNAVTAVSGQNPDGSCASKWDRIGAGLAVAGEGLGLLEELGEGLWDLLRIGCFVEGTPVQMADGTTKSIEQVSVGDMVLSRDQNDGADGKVVAARVTRLYQHDHSSADMVTITLSSGERIECTDNHPFFVPGSGWVPAGKLCLGTQVTPRAGPEALAAGASANVTVVSVVPFTAKAGSTTPVYNFEVEGTHTYFVGTANGGEWVHNKCAGKHHFFPRALGSRIPYGHDVLTPLSAAEHTAVHAELSDFLRTQTKVVNGQTVNMLPGPLNSGARIQQNFTLDERIAAIRQFMQQYQGGRYETALEDELTIARVNGWLR